jgi:Undecaprenyl-phosphate galactose phosphotransferase WbaP
MAADLSALTLCAVFSWWLKSLLDPALSIALYAQALPFLLASFAVVYAQLGLYPGIGIGAANELKRLTQGTSILIAGTIALTFVGQSGQDWSRQIFISTWLLALLAIPLLRACARHTFCRAPWWGIPVAVLGAGATGRSVVALLRARPWLGLRPVAILDDNPSDNAIHGVPIIGKLDDAAKLQVLGIRHAIFAMPSMPAAACARLLDQLSDSLRHIYIAPALPSSPDVIAETREFANTLVLEVQQNLLRTEARVIKRILDIITVVILFLLFWWLFVALALGVKLGSSGRVFYGQPRIGRHGVGFVAWKFRSMVTDADARLEQYLIAHPELRTEWERDHKLRDDPRITWIGRFLRRTSLDELPQLWNILRGEMSLVGPRPIVQAEVVKYGDHIALYHKVRPGLSGLWQVSGRNNTTYDERVRLDCYYVRNWSVWLDLVILSRTVRVVALGEGAY